MGSRIREMGMQGYRDKIMQRYRGMHRDTEIDIQIYRYKRIHI